MGERRDGGSMTLKGAETVSTFRLMTTVVLRHPSKKVDAVRQKTRARLRSETWRW
jgi:hypothetical protein